MQIFKHRPLCLIISFLIAFMATAQFMSVATKLLIVLAAAGIFVLVIVFIKEDKSMWYRVGIMVVGLLLLLGTSARALFYYDLEKDSAKAFRDRSANASVKIVETIYSDSYLTTLKADLVSFDRINTDVRIYLECEYETDFLPGDIINLNLTAYDTQILLEDGYVTQNTIMSEGYSLYCVSYDDSATLIEEGSGLRYSLEKLNRQLCARFDSLLGDECGALASALALGNDSTVPDDVTRDFRRSGLAHILALSGSHIVLIIGTAEVILCKYLRAGKKIRYPILILSLPLYIILVMSPVPVVRAGIMYGIFCLLQIFGKKSDSITNLFISAFVMIFAAPPLVYSLSLWMSFTATLALIVFMPLISNAVYKIKQNRKSGTKALFSLLAGVLISLFLSVVGLMSNIIFLPVFGSFSVVSIPANLIVGPLLTLFLSLCMILLLLIPFSLAPNILVLTIRKLGELILAAVHTMASGKYSVVSLNAGFAEMLCVLFFAFAVIFLIVRVKHKSIMLVPVALFAVLLFVNSYCFSIGDGKLHIVDLKDSQDEALILSNGDDFSLVDISDGRYNNFSQAARAAKENGASEFECVVLTHYHRYHISSVRKLINRECVRRVMIPLPQNSYDLEIYNKLREMLDQSGVPYTLYTNNYSFEIMDGVSIKSFPLERIKRSTHALVSFSITYNSEKFTYIGSSVNEGDNYGKIFDSAIDSDIVILGRHGPIQKNEPIYIFSADSRVYINDDLIARKYLLAPNNGYAETDTDGVIEVVIG